MWQKVRSMMAYIYDNFLDDYDYFHFNGDDTYLIVENLKELLTSEEVQNYEKDGQHLFYAGFWMPHPHKDENFYYLGGGSGYTVSKYALKIEKQHGCLHNLDVAMEDVNVARCFRNMNVTGYDTRYAKTCAQRYHQLNVYRHAVFPTKKFGPSTFLIRKAIEFQNKKFGHPTHWRQGYISDSSVAFHMMYPDWLRRYDHLLYGSAKEQCHEYYYEPALNNKNVTIETNFVINVTTNQTTSFVR